MATKPAPLDCEAILTELGWVRGLARGLSADPHLAEDLTQATFLAAMQHPPKTDRPVKGWLRTVVRNLFNESVRSRLRRESREARAARVEAVSPATEVLERAQMQKKVVDAVMSLEEPYRTTVLLRFFEGLPPRRIASRMAAPVATVKSRLARGLEQLRGRLDREHGGDRRAWLLGLLAPLPKAVLATSTAGVLIVQSKIKLAAAAAIVVGFGGWFAFDQIRDDDRPQAKAPGVEAPESPAATTGDPAAALGTAPIRSRPYEEPAEARAARNADGNGDGASLAAGTGGVASRLRGRVIDTHSAPVAALRVVFRPSGPKEAWSKIAVLSLARSATSGPDGIFEMEAPPGDGSFSVESETHATVLVGSFDAKAPTIEPVIVVAALRKIAGSVVDVDRRPLAGADVKVELPENFRARFDRILDFSETARWATKTDQEGRFAFASAPDLAEARLVARLEGYEDRSTALPAATEPDADIVLSRTRAVRDSLSGQVVDHAGVGVADARVSTGDRTTRSDENGRFTIRIKPERPPAKLVGIKPGYLPAILELTKDAGVAGNLVLRLDGTPLSIAGRVLGADGKPLAGIQVWIPDPLFFARTKEEGIEMVENVLGARRGLWSPVRTGDDGRFVLSGLLPKDYRLQAMDPKTLALEEAGPFAAGSTDVVIKLSNDEMYETVAGQVVSRGKTPVANVSVRPQRDAFHVRITEVGESTSHANIDGAVTDAQGRFTLAKVPKIGVYLRIDGAGVLPLELGREQGLAVATKGQPVDQLRIEVSVRCHLQVDLTGEPDLADEVKVLDATGREVAIDIFYGNGRQTSQTATISAGRTSVLAVPEESSTVVFLKDGKEVDRKGVRLSPGKVTKVTP